MKTKKIAIVGARGIGNYGGFETFVSELAPRLVNKGFKVYCSCEKNGIGELPYHKGVKLIYFPIKISNNYLLRKLFEILYDIYFNIACPIYFKCDIVYSLGVGANIFVLFPRLLGKKSIVNVDGIEWKRPKFNPVERIILKFMFKMTVMGADRIVIDSRSLLNHIDNRYRKKTIYIPYGVSDIEINPWDEKKLQRYIDDNYKIFPDSYWLVVARLEPENNIHTILEGYLKSKSKKPLVVVGDYTSKNYKKAIRAILENDKEGRILMAGAIYNDKSLLDMLRQNCFAYVHGHSVGGTNPSLLEAMSMKNIIVAHDNEFNREVCGESAIYFKDAEELRERIESIEKMPEKYANLKDEIYIKVMKNYSWEGIITEYVDLFSRIGADK
ncbi:Glycosyltransferase [Methanocella conradii HZ254]|uniref:Glycosyltransferase n=1 Tax=Methanocella conradii (strain DSM 24694 / JCM 17849 / CGMCC 1.5162 / HZ254) TaxID=1041930 RepID=H8I4M9_METCZ|nr:DUF1972 domain-containing protein [Methanocella conradii]AFD00208.1 Glycosyltransferase [Methanocella conradii HZ254]MDI6895980.1 DUF1972 domain-containing protein [Methanocella conradii]